MGILNNIDVSFPDTITIATTPKEVILHSCSSATTSYDFYIVLTICLTILLSLVIFALTIGYCIHKNNRTKLGELNARNKHELSKMEKEISWKERKDRYDTACRTIEHAWDERKKDGSSNKTDGSSNKTDGSCNETDLNVKEAWFYIKYFWGLEMPARDSYDKKSKDLNNESTIQH